MAPSFPRTFLFCPASRLTRARKASTLPSVEGVIFDLEDSVPAALKVEARANLSALSACTSFWGVRINPIASPDYALDKSALLTLPHKPHFIMVPKLTSETGLVEAYELSTTLQVPLIFLVETSFTALQVARLAASPFVLGLALGDEDLEAELGCLDLTPPPLIGSLREQIRLACAAYECEAIEGVTAAYSSESANLTHYAPAVALGYRSKLCIHPNQANWWLSSLHPSPEAIRWAEEIVALTKAGGVTGVDGAMIGPPHLAKAHNILQAAGLNGEEK